MADEDTTPETDETPDSIQEEVQTAASEEGAGDTSTVDTPDEAPAPAADNAPVPAPEEKEAEALRGLLRIGIHWDIEVTDVGPPGPRVSQAFCSALPVAYSSAPPADWTLFGRLVLEAAYEATLP